MYLNIGPFPSTQNVYDAINYSDQASVGFSVTAKKKARKPGSSYFLKNIKQVRSKC